MNKEKQPRGHTIDRYGNVVQQAGIDAQAQQTTQSASSYPEGEPTVRWRISDLQAYADDVGIDISGATNNEERVRLLSEG